MTTTEPAVLREFRLPDLGEGLTEGEVLQWLVAVGDVVVVNQPVVEVETAKAAVELPSPYAGTVTELLVPAGATVDVGAPIIRIAARATADAPPVEARADDPAVAEATDLVPSAGREAVLVGYGVRSGGPARRRRRHPVVPLERAAPGAGPGRPQAKPPVRKLARDLGVDLRAVTGSGPGGVVTRADVEAAAGQLPSASPSGTAAGSSEPPEPWPLGGLAARRIPVKGVRKATAQAMVASAFTAPHVTLFHTVDVTESMALVARWRTSADFAGVRVTPLLLVAKALVAACRRSPEINASWDEAAQEIVVHGQVDLGVAAATPRGLLVPTIRAADRLTTFELARALEQLADTARAGRTTPEQLAGGTITLTNVGSFGVDNGTPILNPGEAAILCLGVVREQPWVHRGELAVRSVTQLSMSFDHRMVDGALGARVLSDVGSALEDPSRLLAWS